MGRSDPLHSAAARGDAAVLQQLLASNPSAAATPAGQRATTALHRAAAGGSVACALLLVQANPAATTAEDEVGRLPIHVAIAGQHVGVVAVLLDAVPSAAEFIHAYPNPCCRNTTLLHHAAQRASPAVVRLILASAPHTALIQNGHAHNSLHIAVFGSCWHHGSHNPRAPWHIFIDIARQLLAAAPQAALQRDWAGDTPLHNVALAGCPPALARVVAGAAPEAAELANSEGMLPLGCALAKAADAAAWGTQAVHDAYMRCAAALLDFGPTEMLLRELCAAGEVAHPLFAVLAAARPLTAEQWACVPHGCPGLGALLPTVLARSPAEAPCLARRLLRRDRRRLWEYLRCLARMQRQGGPALPPHVVWQTLGWL